MEELIFQVLNPEFSHAFFGALLSAIGALAGGGGGDNSAAEAQIQAQKLQSATQLADRGVQLAQRAGEQNVQSIQDESLLQQKAMDNLMGGFRQSLLRNLGSGAGPSPFGR